MVSVYSVAFRVSIGNMPRFGKAKVAAENQKICAVDQLHTGYTTGCFDLPGCKVRKIARNVPGCHFRIHQQDCVSQIARTVGNRRREDGVYFEGAIFFFRF